MQNFKTQKRKLTKIAQLQAFIVRSRSIPGVHSVRDKTNFLLKISGEIELNDWLLAKIYRKCKFLFYFVQNFIAEYKCFSRFSVFLLVENPILKIGLRIFFSGRWLHNVDKFLHPICRNGYFSSHLTTLTRHTRPTNLLAWFFSCRYVLAPPCRDFLCLLARTCTFMLRS